MIERHSWWIVGLAVLLIAAIAVLDPPIGWMAHLEREIEGR
jgi:hypothetical protein